MRLAYFLPENVFSLSFFYLLKNGSKWKDSEFFCKHAYSSAPSNSNRHLRLSFVCFADVAAEKTQKAVLEGVEGFDTGKLKHTTTQEKNPLPDKSGNYFLFAVLEP